MSGSSTCGTPRFICPISRPSTSFLIVAGELFHGLQSQFQGSLPERSSQIPFSECRQLLLKRLLSVLRANASRGGGASIKLDLTKDRLELGIVLEYLVHYTDLLKQQQYSILETACKLHHPLQGSSDGCRDSTTGIVESNNTSVTSQTQSWQHPS